MTVIPLGNRQLAFIDALTVADATTAENEQASILASPCVLKRVIVKVTTAVTTDPAEITITWNPVAGSTTDAVTLANFILPVAAVDTVHAYDAYISAGTGPTVLDAGGPRDSGGLGGVQTYEGDSDNVFGPGGEIVIESDGGPAAGAADFFFEVFVLPFEGANVADVGVLVAA